MRRLLWIGDAAVATGFARATHHTLDVLRQTWDVHVLAVNYRGDPHKYPYALYPCWPGGDGFGVGRTSKLVKALKPDVVVVQNDPWNVPEYIEKVEGRAPIVATMPVDGKNLKDGEVLNKLAHAIFWTQFGLEQARAGGYRGPASVIPLGVDLELYRPIDRGEARREVGVPDWAQDGFIIGNVNRNQPRKRLDLTIKAFARWVKEYHVDEARLFLYVAPTGDQGYDCQQLFRYYGLKDRLIIVEPKIGQGHEERWLPYIYSCFDVQITTTHGEGWGLTTMEGMACGVPQIVPNWSALGEWCEDAALKVSCTTTFVTPGGINVLGGVPDEGELVAALQFLYATRSWTAQDGRVSWSWYRDAGLALVSRPEYRWPNIGERFGTVLDELGVQKKEVVA